MIDIRRLRSAPDQLKANLARRNIDVSSIDTVLELDAKAREVATSRDEVRSRVKSLSKDVASAHRDGNKERAEQLTTESRMLGETEKQLDAQSEAFESELRDLLLTIPNEIADSVPDGRSEDDNVVMQEAEPREWQEHQRVPHWVIGEELGILDGERAVKLSGSMFQMLRGAGATLGRALCQLALDRNADAWEEIRPPSLVRTDVLVGTGHLPKFEDELYAVERDGLWTIPTAEVPLTSVRSGEILEESELPQRMMAYTPCFRREAGAAGKDTRGLLRVHEFDKVEMMAYATPEQGEEVMYDILRRSEAMFRDLGLTYRILEICSGDLSRSHHRSFDIEAYAPGVDAWLEVSSVSWFIDYQARRANVRYRPSAGGTAIVHTCNGTAVAVPRAWAAVTETYRQADGSVAVPEVLKPYMRGIDVITAKK